MYCPFCGKELTSTGDLCEHCGALLPEMNAPQAQAQPTQLPATKICRVCRNEIPQRSIYCPICHQKIKGDPVPYAATSAPQKNGMAVAGFVCSFISPLLGWIFGGIGLNRSKQRGGKGKGLSIAALVIASAMFILNLIIML